jgi:hypothetical protein
MPLRRRPLKKRERSKKKSRRREAISLFYATHQKGYFKKAAFPPYFMKR